MLVLERYSLLTTAAYFPFPLAKNGPIYDVVWNPNSVEFCAVYGFMPAKATVFNLKCDPVFDFGTGPRNAAYYSPQGHVLVLAGFGNLRGQMEVWDVKSYKLISKPVASDSTYFAWCPDGEHIVTATCAPRLRVSNGYKVWHYTGPVLHSHAVPPGEELWHVCWQPCPDGTFPAQAVKYQAVPGELPSAEPRPAQAYRPPALRNRPAASSKLVSTQPRARAPLLRLAALPAWGARPQIPVRLMRDVTRVGRLTVTQRGLERFSG